MKKHTKYVPLTVVIFVSFLVGALGVAVGTFIVNAHGGDATKIHACVKSDLVNGAPNVRIIGANDTCKNNETALDWNIQGPTGAPGEGDFVCSSCTPRDLLLRLNQTNLQDANLDQAILNLILVQNTDFTGSSFVGAVLANAQVENANFSNANFTNANLRSFNAPSANFSGANLSGADVYFASFFGANMTNADLTDVIWNSTTCPDGTNSNNNGNTCEGHL